MVIRTTHFVVWSFYPFSLVQVTGSMHGFDPKTVSVFFWYFILHSIYSYSYSISLFVISRLILKKTAKSNKQSDNEVLKYQEGVRHRVLCSTESLLPDLEVAPACFRTITHPFITNILLLQT